MYNFKLITPSRIVFAFLWGICYDTVTCVRGRKGHGRTGNRAAASDRRHPHLYQPGGVPLSSFAFGMGAAVGAGSPAEYHLRPEKVRDPAGGTDSVSAQLPSRISRDGAALHLPVHADLFPRLSQHHSPAHRRTAPVSLSAAGGRDLAAKNRAGNRPGILLPGAICRAFLHWPVRTHSPPASEIRTQSHHDRRGTGPRRAAQHPAHPADAVRGRELHPQDPPVGLCPAGGLYGELSFSLCPGGHEPDLSGLRQFRSL